MKYVVVAGGVVSGLGKGVTISSLGRLLRGCGLRVTSIKIDPYLNVDAGTMSPFEHGEVFVLDDGGETDLDLGNYERFLSISLTSDHNITTGKIYRKVIAKERRGDYLGKTVQVVPHITNEIQDWIERVATIPVDGSDKSADVCLIEVGGTVGDIESSVFFEALRQFQFRVGHDNFCLTFVSLVPVLSNEQKTKPTQHGVRDLRSLGLSPKVIFCRSTQSLDRATCDKIANFCHVQPTHVLSVHDVNNVYHVPLLLRDQNLHKIIAKELHIAHHHQKMELELDSPDLVQWSHMANSLDHFSSTVRIALIGKYTGLHDSYLSVIKSLKHASIACKHKLDLVWVEATKLEHPDNTKKDNLEEEEEENKFDKGEYDASWEAIKSADGVIVPGGFGNRGFLGKVLAAEYCRTNKIPYLGVCLGFQAMVVEYARNVLNMPNANSTEFDENTDHPVIIFMPEVDRENMGGTMRLGARETKFLSKDNVESEPSSGVVGNTGEVIDNENKNNNNNNNNNKNNIHNMGTVQLLYNGKSSIKERHRHRYEVNPKYVPFIHESGLQFLGKDESKTRMEIAELSRIIHPFYIGCQYHPEFQSRPLKPSPPFYGLIMASCNNGKLLDEYLMNMRTRTMEQQQEKIMKKEK